MICRTEMALVCTDETSKLSSRLMDPLVFNSAWIEDSGLDQLALQKTSCSSLIGQILLIYTLAEVKDIHLPNKLHMIRRLEALH